MIGLAALVFVFVFTWPRDPRRAWWFHLFVMLVLGALILGRVIALVTVYNVTGGLPW